MVRLIDRLDMTIVVDIKPQTKQNYQAIVQPAVKNQFKFTLSADELFFNKQKLDFFSFIMGVFCISTLPAAFK